MSLREETRRCPCGTVLERSNRGRECSVCETLRCDAEILGNRRARQVLAARRVAGLFAHPERYGEDRSRYLNDLTDKIDELCDVLGIKRPVLPIPIQQENPVAHAARGIPDDAALERYRRGL